MKKLISACTVLCLFAIASTVSAAPVADIRQLEKDFNDAYAANDLEKYFSYYTNDAIFWFPEGLTDVPSYKKMWGDYLGTGAGIKAGKLSDMHIKLSPRKDVAIASYILHLTTQEADKKIHTENFQETDIWFKTGDSWKITHVHYAPSPAATSAK